MSKDTKRPNLDDAHELDMRDAGLDDAHKPDMLSRANRRARIGMVAAIAAVLVIAVACGGWVWHEDPSFCGAICHEPMDTYVSGYYASPGQVTTDAYGGDASAMLVTTHASEGVSCLQCHPPDIAQQIGELSTWLSGNYDYPLVEKDVKQLLVDAHQPVQGNGSEFCLVEGCHVDADGNPLTEESLRSTLAGKPGYTYRNPHVAPSGSPHGLLEYTCSDCHKSHRASTNACTRCHYDLVPLLPDGWEPWAINAGVLSQVHLQ
ncbi:MAG: cytochrome c3 family protein [Coriobacteriales bacterium]|jgi:hypothetical protein|nr:cytochrome c3 family protein [Coriobacteriales bacterium]